MWEWIWGVQFPIQAQWTCHSLDNQCLSGFAWGTLFHAENGRVQRKHVFNAYEAAKSQHEPLCAPSALTGRDRGGFLPWATTNLTLPSPTIPKWPPHMYFLFRCPANLLLEVQQNRQAILFTGGLFVPLPNFLGTYTSHSILPPLTLTSPIRLPVRYKIVLI